MISEAGQLEVIRTPRRTKWCSKSGKGWDRKRIRIMMARLVAKAFIQMTTLSAHNEPESYRRRPSTVCKVLRCQRFSRFRLLVQLQKLLLRTCFIACKTTHTGRWHTLFTLFIDFLLLRGISMAIKEIYVVHIWTCSKVFACFSFFCVFLGRTKQASSRSFVITLATHCS